MGSIVRVANVSHFPGKTIFRSVRLSSYRRRMRCIINWDRESYIQTNNRCWGELLLGRIRRTRKRLCKFPRFLTFSSSLLFFPPFAFILLPWLQWYNHRFHSSRRKLNIQVPLARNTSYLYTIVYLSLDNHSQLLVEEKLRWKQLHAGLLPSYTWNTMRMAKKWDWQIIFMRFRDVCRALTIIYTHGCTCMCDSVTRRYLCSSEWHLSLRVRIYHFFLSFLPDFGIGNA